MALIFRFSAESEPLPELTIYVWDKLLHAAEYAGLAALVYRALAGEGFRRASAALAALLLTAAYGATDEWHQSLVALRESDPLDWTADIVGAGIGAAACAIYGARSAGLASCNVAAGGQD